MGSQSGSSVWMDELIPEVCWDVVRAESIGRVVYIEEGRPRVLPVNFAVDGRSIVFRTAADGSLGDIPDGTRVAFEVDGTGHVAKTGWSVVVDGTIEQVTDELEIEQLDRLGLEPWASGVRDQWRRIQPAAFSGRAISRRSSR